MSDKPSKGKYIPAMLVSLLGLNVCVVGVTIYAANSDRSMAVEPDYYQKALSWDVSARQLDENRRLGWTADLSTEHASPGHAKLRLELKDARGVTVPADKVEGVCFAYLRAADRQHIQFVPTSDGKFEADLAYAIGGRWQFQINANRNPDTFTASILLDLPVESGH